MNKTLKRMIKRSAPILRKNDVVKAGIFGSYARGENRKDSDVDFLVQFKGRKSMFDLVDLELELGKKLRKKVDLLTYKSINPLIKRNILNDEIRIL